MDEPICPVCGVSPAAGPGSVVRDPELATPVARLRALAAMVDIDVFDDLDGALGGAAVVGVDDVGSVRRIVWVAQTLEDDLRADVLAFGIALLADPCDPVGRAPGSRLGIGRERLAAAAGGAGHVGWHLAAACGRVSPSVTFPVFGLPVL